MNTEQRYSKPKIRCTIKGTFGKRDEFDRCFLTLCFDEFHTKLLLILGFLQHLSESNFIIHGHKLTSEKLDLGSEIEQFLASKVHDVYNTNHLILCDIIIIKEILCQVMINEYYRITMTSEKQKPFS